VRLNSIKLSGFKSFAEPTNFMLPGQLVGVVGPNGCGKSNIMDAVRWVLGESKASELRGESMQDVIFNGTTSRKPASRSSVELVFDNSDHRAGGQWGQFGEIAVKRVLTRDGTSSYYINNQPVRRRDVQDVFLGTGLGPRAYAIIGQGTISRIIESKPEELRLFLEEAAGVSKYKERRRETAHRLGDTRENLTRVEDILRELNANLDKLEKQAEVAARYNASAGERHAQAAPAVVPQAQRGRVATRSRIKAESEKAVNDLESRTADLRRIENELETVRQAHYGAGDLVNQAQGKLYEASAEVGRLEGEIRFVVEGRQRVEQRLVQLREQIGAVGQPPQSRPRPRSETLAESGRGRRGTGRAAGGAARGARRAHARARGRRSCGRRTRPTRSARPSCRCSSRSRCWPPTSATSRSRARQLNQRSERLRADQQGAGRARRGEAGGDAGAARGAQEAAERGRCAAAGPAGQRCRGSTTTAARASRR
jgi:chromosome segregation protein